MLKKTLQARCHASPLLTCVSDLFSQEKLSKDIDYLIGKESQVKSQISELDLLMKETEVCDIFLFSFFYISEVRFAYFSFIHLDIRLLIHKILRVFYELGVQSCVRFSPLLFWH